MIRQWLLLNKLRKASISFLSLFCKKSLNCIQPDDNKIQMNFLISSRHTIMYDKQNSWIIEQYLCSFFIALSFSSSFCSFKAQKITSGKNVWLFLISSFHNISLFIITSLFKCMCLYMYMFVPKALFLFKYFYCVCWIINFTLVHHHISSSLWV